MTDELRDANLQRVPVNEFQPRERREEFGQTERDERLVVTLALRGAPRLELGEDRVQIAELRFDVLEQARHLHRDALCKHNNTT